MKLRIGTRSVLVCALAVAFTGTAQAALTVWLATPGQDGSTLLSLSSAGRGALVVVNRLGQTQVCKPDQWYWSAQARLDQPGFLVGLSASETQGPRLQQWDAQGRVQWEQTGSGTFAALTDGGAVTFSAGPASYELVVTNERAERLVDLGSVAGDGPLVTLEWGHVELNADQVDMLRVICGPRNSDCCRPIVGVMRCPFSRISSSTSVAVRCGPSKSTL